MNILEQILQNKIKEIKERKALYPVKLLENSIFFDSPTVSLRSYLLKENKSGIIAEFKRKSPSKGDINIYADPENVSIAYMQAGASALSVLTDEVFFGGSDKDLTTVRKYNLCPILRKDFILDEYQIIESKSIGADAILLIASILGKDELKKLELFARSLKLEVLFEVRSKDDLNKIDLGSSKIIGVNNRDLTNFKTDINKSIEFSDLIPNEHLKVSESGISDPDTISKLRKYGYKGFLIGETFMKTGDPGTACKSFIKKIRNEQDAS